ncbi:MAG TPA: hypothetical protein VJK90_08795, partial [Acetobacteraceae bacterium]|nr:hypothetical protein [Acetobacteraceae bacterium]
MSAIAGSIPPTSLTLPAISAVGNGRQVARGKQRRRRAEQTPIPTAIVHGRWYDTPGRMNGLIAPQQVGGAPVERKGKAHGVQSSDCRRQQAREDV